MALINQNGYLTNHGLHDSKVSNVTLDRSGNLCIIAFNQDNALKYFFAEGCSIVENTLSSGDIITEIFFWDESSFINIPSSDFRNLMKNFGGEFVQMSLNDFVVYLGSERGVLQIYCATQGELAAICVGVSVKSCA